METDLGRHSPWRGSVDAPDGLPDRWRTAELTSKGLSGTKGNEDGDAGHRHVRDTVVILEEGNL